jgi:Zn/Cd-binding protein ZinT
VVDEEVQPRNNSDWIMSWAGVTPLVYRGNPTQNQTEIFKELKKEVSEEKWLKTYEQLDALLRLEK